VHGEVPDEVIERLKAGVELEDGPARFDEIATISRGGSHSWFRVTIREGRNREVRRLWDSQGFLVSRLKRIRYGTVELPRALRRGDCENLDDTAIKALRERAGLGAPAPVLTLSAVVHQRRAPRHVTEYRPDKATTGAWSSARHDEARELTAFDRLRDDTPGRAGKGGRGGRGAPGGQGGRREVNGNVDRPDRANKPRKPSSRRVAPGQELPAMRTWFAGDSRTGGGNANGNVAGGNPNGNRSGGARGPRTGGQGGQGGGNRTGQGGGGNRAAGGQGGGNRAYGAPGGGNRAQGQGGPSRSGGNRASGGPGGAGGNRGPRGPGGGGGGNRGGQGGQGGNRGPRGGNRGGSGGGNRGGNF
jgi:23S rRNA pseudouridine2605 synthase